MDSHGEEIARQERRIDRIRQEDIVGNKRFRNIEHQLK